VLIERSAGTGGFFPIFSAQGFATKIKLTIPIEAQLAPFDARPHWGKLFTMAPARLHSLYQKLPDFQRLLTSYDPQGKFRNPFLDTYIFGA